MQVTVVILSSYRLPPNIRTEAKFSVQPRMNMAGRTQVLSVAAQGCNAHAGVLLTSVCLSVAAKGAAHT